MTTTSLLPPHRSMIAETGQRSALQLHYKPLDGTSLREMAALKRHHRPDGGFVNPLGRLRRRSIWKVVQWKLFSKNRYGSDLARQAVVPVHVDWKAVHRHTGLSVTFIKHASVLIKDQDTFLLVDPVFSGLFRFMRDYSPLAFDISEMPQPDHILITHGHYDHLHRPTLCKLGRRTHVIAPLGYDRIFDRIGMHDRTHLDWFQTYSDKCRSVTLLPCNHWTMRNPIAGVNLSLWGSYLIETAAGKTIYISGDTAYFDGFSELGREFDIDLAIFNLGAYEPRWFMAPSHMNPQETLNAFNQLQARQLIITHWGTFRLGDEPVHFPPRDLRQILAEQGLLDRLIDIKHGDTCFVT